MTAKPEEVQDWIHSIQCLRRLILNAFPAKTPTIGRIMEELRLLENGLRCVLLGGPGQFSENHYLEALRLITLQAPPSRAVRARWLEGVLT